MPPIRVVIADDHPIVRDGLYTALAVRGHLEVVGLVATFDEALDILAATPVDIVVLDLNGMRGSPFLLVERIRRDYPQTEMVVFSSTVDLAPELLGAGVRGYVVKEEISEHLLRAVQQAMQKRRYLSPLAADYVERSHKSRRKYRLAPKELSCVKLVAQGLDTPEIATQLGIDQRVVQNYISTALRKVGCTNRVQLADWYRRTFGHETR